MGQVIAEVTFEELKLAHAGSNEMDLGKLLMKMFKDRGIRMRRFKMLPKPPAHILTDTENNVFVIRQDQ